MTSAVDAPPLGSRSNAQGQPEPGTDDLPRADVQSGDVLAGKYRVERVLGAGGMGVVVAAHHIQLDEKVALKFLLRPALDNPEAIARFKREARAAVRIKNEHVARVIDVGELEDGAPYMVMEYLDGIDLSGWLKQHGAMPVEQAVDFVLQACEALAEAHALGIVHRDLKPANLFCIERPDGQPSVKVLDFGISKVTSADAKGQDMTRTSALMGSPLYMSPEQMASSKAVDARADIWALGVILFELMAGHPPFEAEAITELVVKVTMQAAPLLRTVRPEVPPGLEQVVARCLEKDRTRRFQTIADLAISLKDFGPKSAQLSIDRVLGTLRRAGITGGAGTQTNEPGSTASSTASAPPAAPGATPNTIASASWGQTGSTTEPAPARKAPLAIAIAAVGGAVILVAVTGAVLARRHSAAPATATAAAATSTTVPAAPSTTPEPATEPSPARNAGAPEVPTAAAASASPGPAARGAAGTRHRAAATPPPERAPSGAARPASAPAPSATAAPMATAKPNCNPPYVIDANGDRQYKPECL